MAGKYCNHTAVDTEINKVITTMVIRPLDDRTYCVHLRQLIWGFGKSCTIVQGIN